ncbi:hypothetical protein [Paenibacillus flagellatus]|uniref:Uncharacterized protein n=1 Tax=Paenibacillus flagellatus TaxID=2211139 RepID=A0A2V5K577_9BACL|nr:hypothetical protein [Paenibacillus flagellatus]PYI54509.1 hypothetical protein DLM86_13670 [Paenibacillus flagellatus]
MYTIHIELHKDKHLYVLTDNAKLNGLIRRQSFMLGPRDEDGFYAVVIDTDRDGYRKAVHVDVWLQQIARAGAVGDFIAVKQYVDENGPAGGDLFCSGRYRKTVVREAVRLLRAIAVRPAVYGGYGREKVTARIGTLQASYVEPQPADDIGIGAEGK